MNIQKLKRKLMEGVARPVWGTLNAPVPVLLETASEYFSFIRAVAIVTVTCFIVSSIAGPAIAQVSQVAEENRKYAQVFDDFVLPYTAARITGASYSASPRVVIQIQDLHCHGEVQRNINRVLSLVNEKYPVSKIYLGGAYGSVDTSWLNAISDKEMRQAVVESLVDQGKLTGVEYFSASGNSVPVMGLEDKDIYNANLLRLGRILDSQADVDKALSGIELELARLKARYYNPKQKALDILSAKYRKEEVKTNDFYRELKKLGDKNGLDIYEYRNMTAFLGLMELEKELNYKRISRQLQEFIITLKQRLPYDAYKVLLEKMNDFSRLDELYVYLIKLDRDFKLGLSNTFPNLSTFFAYIDASQKVNPVNLVNEERRFVRELQKKLSANATEKEVVFIADFYSTLAEYYTNRLTAEDYEYYLKNEREFKVLWSKYSDSYYLSGLEPFNAILNDYYVANIERNRRFVKNILSASDTPAGTEASPYVNSVSETLKSLKNATEIDIVVTGGFHTLGLSELLAEKNISYLVITPNVTKDTKYASDVYNALAKQQFKVLLGEERPSTSAQIQGQTTDRFAKNTPQKGALALPVISGDEWDAGYIHSATLAQGGLGALVKANSDPNSVVGQINREILKDGRIKMSYNGENEYSLRDGSYGKIIQKYTVTPEGNVEIVGSSEFSSKPQAFGLTSKTQLISEVYISMLSVGVSAVPFMKLAEYTLAFQNMSVKALDNLVGKSRSYDGKTFKIVNDSRLEPASQKALAALKTKLLERRTELRQITEKFAPENTNGRMPVTINVVEGDVLPIDDDSLAFATVKLDNGTLVLYITEGLLKSISRIPAGDKKERIIKSLLQWELSEYIYLNVADNALETKDGLGRVVSLTYRDFYNKEMKEAQVKGDKWEFAELFAFADRERAKLQKLVYEEAKRVTLVPSTRNSIDKISDPVEKRQAYAAAIRSAVRAWTISYLNEYKKERAGDLVALVGEITPSSFYRNAESDEYVFAVEENARALSLDDLIAGIREKLVNDQLLGLGIAKGSQEEKDFFRLEARIPEAFYSISNEFNNLMPVKAVLTKLEGPQDALTAAELKNTDLARSIQVKVVMNELSDKANKIKADLVQKVLPAQIYRNIPTASILDPLINRLNISQSFAKFFTVILAPGWETIALYFAFNAFGFGWAVLGFAFAHTIVDWVVRTNQDGLAKAFSINNLKSDISKFSVRLLLAGAFVVPFEFFSPIAAGVISFITHAVYNYAVLSRGWSLPLASLTTPAFDLNKENRKLRIYRFLDEKCGIRTDKLNSKEVFWKDGVRTNLYTWIARRRLLPESTLTVAWGAALSDAAYIKSLDKSKLRDFAAQQGIDITNSRQPWADVTNLYQEKSRFFSLLRSELFGSKNMTFDELKFIPVRVNDKGEFEIIEYLLETTDKNGNDKTWVSREFVLTPSKYYYDKKLMKVSIRQYIDGYSAVKQELDEKNLFYEEELDRLIETSEISNIRRIGNIIKPAVIAVGTFFSTMFLSGTSYAAQVIQKGDSLWKIAKNQLINSGISSPRNAQISEMVDKIKEVNPAINPNLLRIGQEINVDVAEKVQPSVQPLVEAVANTPQAAETAAQAVTNVSANAAPAADVVSQALPQVADAASKLADFYQAVEPGARQGAEIAYPVVNAVQNAVPAVNTAVPSVNMFDSLVTSMQSTILDAFTYIQSIGQSYPSIAATVGIIAIAVGVVFLGYKAFLRNKAVETLVFRTKDEGLRSKNLTWLYESNRPIALNTAAKDYTLNNVREIIKINRQSKNGVEGLSGGKIKVDYSDSVLKQYSIYELSRLVEEIIRPQLSTGSKIRLSVINDLKRAPGVSISLLYRVTNGAFGSVSLNLAGHPEARLLYEQAGIFFDSGLIVPLLAIGKELYGASYEFPEPKDVGQEESMKEQESVLAKSLETARRVAAQEKKIEKPNEMDALASEVVTYMHEKARSGILLPWPVFSFLYKRGFFKKSAEKFRYAAEGQRRFTMPELLVSGRVAKLASVRLAAMGKGDAETKKKELEIERAKAEPDAAIINELERSIDMIEANGKIEALRKELDSINADIKKQAKQGVDNPLKGNARKGAIEFEIERSEFNLLNMKYQVQSEIRNEFIAKYQALAKKEVGDMDFSSYDKLFNNIVDKINIVVKAAGNDKDIADLSEMLGLPLEVVVGAIEGHRIGSDKLYLVNRLIKELNRYGSKYSSALEMLNYYKYDVEARDFVAGLVKNADTIIPDSFVKSNPAYFYEWFRISLQAFMGLGIYVLPALIFYGTAFVFMPIPIIFGVIFGLITYYVAWAPAHKFSLHVTGVFVKWFGRGVRGHERIKYIDRYIDDKYTADVPLRVSNVISKISASEDDFDVAIKYLRQTLERDIALLKRHPNNLEFNIIIRSDTNPYKSARNKEIVDYEMKVMRELIEEYREELPNLNIGYFNMGAREWVNNTNGKLGQGGFGMKAGGIALQMQLFEEGYTKSRIYVDESHEHSMRDNPVFCAVVATDLAKMLGHEKSHDTRDKAARGELNESIHRDILAGNDLKLTKDYGYRDKLSLLSDDKNIVLEVGETDKMLAIMLHPANKHIVMTTPHIVVTPPYIDGVPQSSWWWKLMKVSRDIHNEFNARLMASIYGNGSAFFGKGVVRQGKYYQNVFKRETLSIARILSHDWQESIFSVYTEALYGSLNYSVEILQKSEDEMLLQVNLNDDTRFVKIVFDRKKGQVEVYEEDYAGGDGKFTLAKVFLLKDICVSTEFNDLAGILKLSPEAAKDFKERQSKEVLRVYDLVSSGVLKKVKDEKDKKEFISKKLSEFENLRGVSNLSAAEKEKAVENYKNDLLAAFDKKHILDKKIGAHIAELAERAEIKFNGDARKIAEYMLRRGNAYQNQLLAELKSAELARNIPIIKARMIDEFGHLMTIDHVSKIVTNSYGNSYSMGERDQLNPLTYLMRDARWLLGDIQMARTELPYKAFLPPAHQTHTEGIMRRLLGNSFFLAFVVLSNLIWIFPTVLALPAVVPIQVALILITAFGILYKDRIGDPFSYAVNMAKAEGRELSLVGRVVTYIPLFFQGIFEIVVTTLVSLLLVVISPLITFAMYLYEKSGKSPSWTPSSVVSTMELKKPISRKEFADMSARLELEGLSKDEIQMLRDSLSKEGNEKSEIISYILQSAQNQGLDIKAMQKDIKRIAGGISQKEYKDVLLFKAVKIGIFAVLTFGVFIWLGVTPVTAFYDYGIF